MNVDTTPGQIYVGPGESLSSIAAKWAGDGASRGQVNDLKNQFIAVNKDIDPNHLQPGQALNYPQAGTVVDSATYALARDADIANIASRPIGIPAIVVDQPSVSDATAVAMLAIALQKPAGIGDPGVDYDPAYLARFNNGPQLAAYDAKAAAAQAAQQQYDGNSLALALWGPVLGAGGIYARAFGASEDTVSSLTTASVGIGLSLAGIPEAGSISRSLVPTPPAGWTAQAEYAGELYDFAKLAEPGTTQTLTDIANDTGGRLVGLDARLKTLDSLTRKVENSPERTINDALRNTMVFDGPSFTEGVQDTMGALGDQGHQLVWVSNFFQEGVPYKGINTTFEDPAGQEYELQFHTPESFDMKNTVNHPLYEQFRVLDPQSPQWQQIMQQMIQNSNSVQVPPGAGQIKWTKP